MMVCIGLHSLSFGDWIVNTRLSKRLDAKECAERAGVTPQAWSEWEVGRSRRKDGKPARPTMDTIRKIAHALEEPVSSAMAEAGYVANDDASKTNLNAPTRPRLIIYEGDSDQLPPELEVVYALHGRVFRELPPGPARDRYIEKLRADAEASLAMIEMRLANEEHRQ